MSLHFRPLTTAFVCLSLAVGCGDRPAPELTGATAPVKVDDTVPLADVAAAIDAYLAVYEEGVRQTQHAVLTGGYIGPTPAQWAAMKASLPQSVASRPRLLEGVRTLTSDTLDVMLGFDLRYAPLTTAQGLGVRAPEGLAEYAQLRGLALDARHSHPVAQPGAVTLRAIRAARDAYRAALTSKDHEAVAAALRELWLEYPGYSPMHSGRCWSHGHEYVEVLLKSSEECQRDYLKAYAGQVLMRFGDAARYAEHVQPEVERVAAAAADGTETQRQPLTELQPSCTCYYGYADQCGSVYNIFRYCGGYGACSGSGSSDGTCQWFWQ